MNYLKDVVWKIKTYIFDRINSFGQNTIKSFIVLLIM